MNKRIKKAKTGKVPAKTKAGSNLPSRVGEPLWFVRTMLGPDQDMLSDEAGDLLAIAVRMSEADRKRMVTILNKQSL